MWKSPGKPVPLHPSQLTIGLYVWLDVPWDDHPFLSNRFLLKSHSDVSIVQALHVEGRLYYHPDKSTAAPLEPAQPSAAVKAAEAAAERAAIRESERLNKLKHELQRKHRDAAVRADRAWENAARETKLALLTLGRSPKSAGEALARLSCQTADRVASASELLLHLLGDKLEQGPQFHALNVLTLCMVLGKRLELGQTELADLALAALAHDVGKIQVPLHILQSPSRKRFEEDFYRQHVMFSVQLAKASGAFSREALAMIADHHEAVDGSGWPRGHDYAHRNTQILTVVNRYDNLCTPPTPAVEPLMPAEALSHMYQHERTRYNPIVLTTLIKLLGVYPPGTVVRLTDDSLCLVVAPGTSSLHPEVLIYTPEMHKADAPTIELSPGTDLQIAEAIRPSALPADVRKWLNPQQRLSYFYSVNPPDE